MGGTNLARQESDRCRRRCRVTIAGGVTTAEEIKALDEIGADAQVGMALYTGKLDLADAIMAPLVATARTASGRPWSSTSAAWRWASSTRPAIGPRGGAAGTGVYQSRSRGLWVKGETSGAVQELLRIDLDCDRDSPRFVVRQSGPGFCHLDTRTCWGEDAGLGHWRARWPAPRATAPAGPTRPSSSPIRRCWATNCARRRPS